LKVLLGKYLTSSSQWSASSGCKVGEVTVGPSGFLQLLCTQTGVKFNDEAGGIERLAAYQSAIDAVVSEGDFYAASYNVDPTGTARSLLTIRDDLLISANSGFDLVASDFNPRITSMASIEAVFNQNPVHSSTAEVIGAVLSSKIVPAIKSFSLIEESNKWPALWQEVFLWLKAGGVEQVELVPTVAANHGENSTDLSNIDLTNSRLESKKPLFGDDGSFLHIRTSGVLEAADATAALIGAYTQKGLGTVVIGSNEMSALDQALARLDLPKLGHHEDTGGQALRALLPLTIQSASFPVNPNSMIAMLSVDPHPLPRGLRNMLISKICRSPGTLTSLYCDSVDIYTKDMEDTDATESQIVMWKEWLSLSDMHVDGKILRQTFERILTLCEEFSKRVEKRPKLTSTLRQSTRQLLGDVEGARCLLACNLQAEFTLVKIVASKDLLAQQTVLHHL